MAGDKPSKLYYSISEVSALTDTKPHILRFWEKDFSVLRPKKNSAGNRAYRERDVRVVLAIKRLLYEEKYTIKGARERLLKDRALIDEMEIVPPVSQEADAPTMQTDPIPASAPSETPDPEGLSPAGPEPSPDASDVGATSALRVLADVRQGLQDLLRLVDGPAGG